MANVITHLNTNILRHLKIGKHLGESFDGDRGSGQGCTWSLIKAIVATTVQARNVTRHHPLVKVSSVVDDRTFRGPPAETILAVRRALLFDHRAGLINNCDKFVGTATTPEARTTLANTQFNGHKLKVSLESVLVGAQITTRLAPRRAMQNRRVTKAIDFAVRCHRASVASSLKAYATTIAAIPKILHGSMWCLPSTRETNKLRTHMITTLFGPNRLMRCPELVVTLTANVVRANPISAIVYRTMNDMRRIFHKHPNLIDKVRETLAILSSTQAPDCQGPAKGLITAAEQILAHVTVAVDGDIKVTQSGSDTTISLGQTTTRTTRPP